MVGMLAHQRVTWLLSVQSMLANCATFAHLQQLLHQQVPANKFLGALLVVMMLERQCWGACHTNHCLLLVVVATLVVLVVY